MARTPVDRVERPAFWSHVIKTADCWSWQGRTHRGYGKYGRWLAHRLAYELMVGPIPKGLELDHRCVNPRCVNPDHLEPVTHAENTRRMVDRNTRCRAGHAWTPANTYLRPVGTRGDSGPRDCRACRAEAARRLRARRVA